MLGSQIDSSVCVYVSWLLNDDDTAIITDSWGDRAVVLENHGTYLSVAPDHSDTIEYIDIDPDAEYETTL